jgi:hypothetical protein
METQPESSMTPTMRNLIKIMETMIYRDRMAKPAGDGRIIAVNPTKREWDHWFPRGAGAVLCYNGAIAVGAGAMLPHDEILSLAKLPADQEKWRAQLGRTAAFVELWFSYDDVGERPSSAVIAARCLTQFGASLEQIADDLKQAVTPFMGEVPVRAIPLGDDGDPLLPGDAEFIQQTFPQSH